MDETSSGCTVTLPSLFQSYYAEFYGGIRSHVGLLVNKFYSIGFIHHHTRDSTEPEVGILKTLETALSTSTPERARQLMADFLIILESVRATEGLALKFKGEVLSQCGVQLPPPSEQAMKVSGCKMSVTCSDQGVHPQSAPANLDHRVGYEVLAYPDSDSQQGVAHSQLILIANTSGFVSVGGEVSSALFPVIPFPVGTTARAHRSIRSDSSLSGAYLVSTPLHLRQRAFVDHPAPDTPSASSEMDELRRRMSNVGLDPSLPSPPPLVDPSGGTLRSSDLPAIKETNSPLSPSSPRTAQSHPASTVSDGQTLAAPQTGTPMSTEETTSHHHDGCDFVLAPISSATSQELVNISCKGCADKQQRIVQLECEMQQQESIITEDKCFLQKKIEEIKLLREKLKNKESERRRLDEELRHVQIKYKKLEGQYHLAMEEVKEVQTLKHQLDKAEQEKKRLEEELLTKFVEQHYVYMLKVELVHEREEKEELHQMVQTLLSKVEQQEHALNLAYKAPYNLSNEDGPHRAQT